MQLIYLWVNNYRNFKNQGFNFHPAYEFSYDADTHGLRYEKKNDLPANFWGQNISSVTAVVGENGVGKTTLLEGIIREAWEESTRIILLVEDGGKFYVKKGLGRYQLLTKGETKGETVYVSKEQSKLVYYSGIINTLPNSKRYIASYRLNEAVSSNELLYKNKEVFDYQDESLRNVLSFLFKIESLEQFPSFLQKAKLIHFSRVLFASFSTEDRKILSEKSPISILCTQLWYYYPSPYREAFVTIISELNSFIHSSRNENQSVELEEDLKKFRSTIPFIDQCNKGENIVWSKDHKLQLKGFLETIRTSLKSMDKVRFIEEIFEYVNVYDDYIHEFYIDDLDKKTTTINLGDQSKLELLKKLLHHSGAENLIKSVFINIQFQSLSSGEEAMLLLFSRLYNRLEGKKGSYLLLLDEADLGFHPDWQKKYLGLLLESLGVLFPDITFQLILATHSPFILSDIPKSNCIFLKKDEEGNSQVDEGLAISNTFGANIHELLADAFFMKGGLIGDFAKGKIEKVLEYLKRDELEEAEKEEIKQIIDMIGEPLIQEELMHRYKRKYGDVLSKEEQIKKLKAQLKALEDDTTE